MRSSHLILSCKEKYKVHNITVVRIAEYINTVVGRRKTSQDRSAVVMKLDVEVRIQKHPCFKNLKYNIKGLELEVLADLIHSGALQHLDYIYIDFHEWMDKDHKSFRYLICIY